MASEYVRIHSRAAEDPGTAGDEGEENWAALFRNWLPPTYHIQTKGRIIAHDGSLSPQVDLLVLKPSYPNKLREKKVWLAAGVAAAFECKTTLTAGHVNEAVERCVRIKSLYTQRVGSPQKELQSPLIYGLLAHSHSWKGERSDPLWNISNKLEHSSKIPSHPRLELDVLCVADLATFNRSYITAYDAEWNPNERLRLEAEFGGARGPMTSMMCSASNAERQSSEFRPTGALIGLLIQRLAWEDPQVRDIADYFRLANLWGVSQGSMRVWPLSVYSDEVRKQIQVGRRTNGVRWDEWSVLGI